MTLVEDIIRLSQLDEQAELPKENVSLYEIANEACGVLRDSADKKDISLSVVGDSGNVYGVEHLLFEVIYNLYDNAVKYTPDGGKVDVNIAETEKEVTLTVSDNGIGIAPEYHARIFERFYRVDKARSREMGGTGLGLPIAKEIIESNGGSIDIKSSTGKGTEVVMKIPCK